MYSNLRRAHSRSRFHTVISLYSLPFLVVSLLSLWSSPISFITHSHHGEIRTHKASLSSALPVRFSPAAHHNDVAIFAHIISGSPSTLSQTWRHLRISMWLLWCLFQRLGQLVGSGAPDCGLFLKLPQVILRISQVWVPPAKHYPLPWF